MTGKRHIHADLIIMQANDISLRFDYFDDNSKAWSLVTEVPFRFHPNIEYRLHEREFPKTSFSGEEFRRVWLGLPQDMKLEDALLLIANAAIEKYILDTEKDGK